MIVVRAADHLAGALGRKYAGDIRAAGHSDGELIRGGIGIRVGLWVAPNAREKPAVWHGLLQCVGAWRDSEGFAAAVGIAITGCNVVEEERAKPAIKAKI